MMADEESLRAGWVYKFEIVFLGCFLFYADVVSDIISLSRFWRHGQKWFFCINAGGIGLNMLSSAVFGCFVGDRPGGYGNLTEFLMGLFQLHPLIMAWRVLSTGQKLNENESTLSALLRAFELIESCCSLLVQGYVVVWDTSLSGSNELQLQASVCMSLLSLANGLVLLDKIPIASADEVARVTSIASWSFVVTFVYRVFELILSFGSLFLFQLAARPYGGLVVLVAVAVCMLIVMIARRENLKAGSDWKVTCFVMCLVAPVMVFPLCFFHASPASGAPRGILTLGPSRLDYFVFRLAKVGLMFAYLVFRAGSVGAIWDFWKPYNASAIFLAYAVGISLVGYTTTFMLMCKRSHGLLQDAPLPNDDDINARALSNMALPDTSPSNNLLEGSVE